MAAFNIEQAVSELANLGIERSDALACLNACNNDLVRAADYFYGSGDLQKARDDYKWDASLFDADRDGNPSTQTGHSYDNNFQTEFQIQAPDVHVGSGYEGTKSRPPSRVSNRAGGSAAGYQGSEIVFLPPWPGPEDSWMGTADSDPDLARALAASMEGSAAHTVDFGAQETGITGTRTSPATSYLQPANPGREYNPQLWALTTTHEIFLDPGPSERKRKPGDPAFLRPSSSGGNVAALLTILHGIPAARESLLARDCLDRDYGHDDQWWNGQQIRILRVTNTSDGETGEPEITEGVIEVQRLMAFLDGTLRAYGSVESLAMIPGYHEPNQARESDTSSESLRVWRQLIDFLDAPSAFFRSWTSAIEKATPEPAEGKYSRTFFSEAIQCARGAKDGALMNSQVFQMMDLVGPTVGETTLYDMLDSLVIPMDYETDVFVKFAPVICAQIRPPDNGMFNGCPIAIPTALYPDRYTQAWAGPMREVRRRIEEQKSIIAEIELQEDKLKRVQVNEGAYHELQSVPQPRELLSILVEHYVAEGNREAPTGIANGVGSESSAVLAMLEGVIHQLDAKLEALARKKEEAYQTLVNLRSSLTSPEDLDPSLPPMTRYTLRGVSPESSTTFTLLQSCDSEEGQASAGSSTGSPGEQWWCINWTPRAPATGWETTPTLNYEVKKVTEEKVMHAIKTTGEGTVLLVYANDEALNLGEEIDTSLPGPLQTFVDRDNAAFKAELQPNSPGRKRHNDWLDAEDEGANSSPGAGFSPKRVSSSRSSATLGNATPEVSRRNSLSGNEIEMMEGIGSGNNQPTTGGGNTIGQEIDLSQPGGEEMQERGGISPVAKAFHLDSKGRERDLDQDMKDIDSEHIGFTDSLEKRV
ncbi:unnamed protein product [Tuber aestivum]|uniref:UBA domain-containing protein n=1 Tax=Tuber aestivum TaxID=59557 RepID=A0A292PTS5_9PEZI|nr:unnamed protein product [Tuber aestivum]